MSEHLVILSDAKHIAIARQRLGSAVEDAIFVYWDWWTKQALEKEGLACCLINDFCTAQDCMDINRAVLKAARTWYKPGGVDMTLYRGVSLGWCSEQECQNNWAEFYRWPVAGSNAIRSQGVRYIWHDMVVQDNVAVEALSLAAGSFGITINPLLQESEQDSAVSYLGSRYWSIKSSRGALDLTARRVLSGFISSLISLPLWKRYFVCKTLGLPKVLFVPGGMQIYHVIEAWRRMSPKPFALQLLVDPGSHDLGFRLMRFLLRGRYDPLLLKIGSCPQAIVDQMIQDWDKAALDSEYAAEFTFRDLPMFELLAPAARRLMQATFGRLMFQVDNLRPQLVKENIKGIVLYIDAAQMPRLLIALGRQLGILSIVIQHGVYTSPDLDFDRRSADYAILWGEAVREAYLAQGEPAQRLLVTGAPSADKLQPAFRSGDHVDGQRVVVLTSYSGLRNALSWHTSTEEFILIVMEALKRVGGWREIVIKAHPSQDADRYRLILADYDLSNVRITRRATLPQVLTDADLAICEMSSAALEAIAMGCSVVSLQPSQARYSSSFMRSIILPPFDGSDGLPVVDNLLALENWLRAWKSNSRLIERNSESSLRYIERYFGAVGDQNSFRVNAIIRDIIQGMSQA